MGQANFTSGIENVTFSPDQVNVINQQATNDVQTFLQNQPPPPPEPIITGPPPPPTQVVDPSWDPVLLNEVLTELGKAYDPEHDTPSVGDVNASLKGSSFYRQSVLEGLDHYEFADYAYRNEDRNTFFLFKYQNILYSTSNSNRYVFAQLNYKFLTDRKGYTYAADPGINFFDLFPGVDFSQHSVGDVYGDPTKRSDNPLYNTFDDQIVKPPKSPDDQSQMSPMNIILIAAAVGAVILLIPKRRSK